MIKPVYSLLLISLACCVTNSATAKYRQQTDTSQKKYADEKPPAFPGGVDGWRKYLEANLHYPKKAWKKHIQGLVKVKMTVDAKGNVGEVEALNDPGGGLAAEAVRVIKEGPTWIPAFQDGKNVTYRFVQNITFELQ
jgi:TonB family protein